MAGGRGAAACIGTADSEQLTLEGDIVISVCSGGASGANGACCGAYPSEVASDVPDVGADAVDRAGATVALGGTGAAGN